MSDLFTLASTCRAAIESTYAAAAAHPAARAVRDQVFHAGRVCFNLKPADLKAFLDQGRYHNCFEVARAEAAATGQSVDTILQSRLKAWYRPRCDFEASFGGGRSLYYGSLNAGGLGAPRYGRWCLVTVHGAQAPDSDRVFLVGDSLKSFGPDPTDAAFRTQLVAGLAPADRGAELTAMKLASRAGTLTSPEEIALAVCSNDDYVEAILSTAPTPAVVERARLDRSEADLMSEYARKRLLGAQLPPEAIPQLDAYNKLRKALSQNSIGVDVLS